MPRNEKTCTDAEDSIDDVEDDGDPDGQVAGAAPPQPDRDEQLGEDDELGRSGVEVAVGEERDRPIRERRRLQVLPGPDDALPRHGAAEPVGIEELAEPGRPVDRGRTRTGAATAAMPGR